MTPSNELKVVARHLAQVLDSWKLWGVAQIPTRSAPPSVPSTRHAFADLERDVQACRRCSLYRTRTHAVLGEGRLDARLVFVGEAPGREEDVQGRPFVGAAGQLLTKMIEAIGLKREAVYICNVLKDRPPGNRTPLPEEVQACRPFLVRQLALIQPAVICVLGAVAAKALLGEGIDITKIRGQAQSYGSALLVPTFHPAYLLRNPPAKRLVWQDLKLVKRLLEQGPASSR